MDDNNCYITLSSSNLKINNLISNINQTPIFSNNKNNINNLNINQKGRNSLNFYSRCLCYIKATSLKTIQERINKNEQKIKEIEKDINENPNKYNCCTYFVVFKYIRMRDKIYQFFPTNLFSKLAVHIKYFIQNILFNSCVNEKTKRANFLKLSFTLEHAKEAYEVLWKNLGYTQKEKYFFLILSIIVTLILVGISLCIVLLLNHVQYNLIKMVWKMFGDIYYLF